MAKKKNKNKGKAKKNKNKGKTKGKKPALHGIAKAEHVNAKRTLRARRQDARRSSKHQFKKANEKNIEKWGKNPGRSDMKGVDTKRKLKPKKK